MLVSFNPAISRQQNPKFGWLEPKQIANITRSLKTAEIFENGILDGVKYSADEIRQLRTAAKKLKDEGELESAFVINRALDRLI